MSNLLLRSEIQDFIRSHSSADVAKLALQKNPFPDVKWNVIIEQIASYQKAKEKLPTWFSSKFILYPPKVSIEQTSSEITAKYKSTLIKGASIIDLTGGFGVDAYYFSKQLKLVVHCEMNEELSLIAAHNFKELKIQNIDCFPIESSAVLKKLDTTFDCIYVDPSRRNDSKEKVFQLKDCAPNVPDLLPFYFQYTDTIFVKTAPFLDIQAGLGELNFVKNIHIIAVDNEVKELLWELSRGYSSAATIKTVNLKKERNEVFEFRLNENQQHVTFGFPKKYVYEPNSAIMKSGGFDEIAIQFQLEKLHSNSHLYTSNDLIPFPGRVFSIQETISYQKNEMKLKLNGIKANISTRNFPESVEEIRKKWNLKDGGETYCFFTTNFKNRKIVLLCTKI